MQSFSLIAALAALTANVNALCDDLGTGNCAFAVWQEIQAAFDNTLSGTDYEWQLKNASSGDYSIRMVRFVGDANGDNVTDQNTKQPVLFYQRGDRPCFKWITEDTTAEDLFVAGHDVWIGCRRGQDISDSNSNSLSEEDYWNFDIQDAGEDVTDMIEKINQIRNTEGSDCLKTAVVTGGLSTNEVLSSAVAYPNSFDDFVSNVIGVAPCIVSTVADVGEGSRRLQALTESRSLHTSDDYWAGVEELCLAFPGACYDYCDFFPYLCDEFCDRFPSFCRPERVDDFETFRDDMQSLGYWALWKDDEGGETWFEKVVSFCAINDGRWCTLLQDTVAIDHPPYSLKQFEHQFQNGYASSFHEFSDTFFVDGWQEDMPVSTPVDLSTILTKFDNLYPTQDALVCKIDETKDVFTDVALPGFFAQFNSDDLSSTNPGFTFYVNALLSANEGGAAPADCSAFNFVN